MQGAAGGGDCSKMLHKDGLLKPNDWLGSEIRIAASRKRLAWPVHATREHAHTINNG
jgi:hypothetical protein